MSKILYCEKCNYILGITSLWLIIPIYYGINYNIISIYIFLLTFFMSMACIISTIMWKNRNNSIFLYYFDMLIAKSIFILLIIITINTECNIMCLFNKILFSLLLVLFYIGGFIFYFNNMIQISTCFHILLRYTGFIWCCFLVSCPYIYLYPLSITYFSHIYYEWNKINYINKICNNNFTCNQYYNNGCINLIKIIILIFLCIYLHNLYIK